MALSFTYLSLVVLFNSFFIANFLLMRALRRYMDATSTLRRQNDNGDNATPSLSIEEKISKNNILLFFCGLPLSIYLKIKQKMAKRDSSTDGGREDSTCDAITAYCFGFTRKQKYEAQAFPNWDPLPYKFGALTTSTIIVLFAIVFSDRILNKTLGLDASDTSPMGGVCTDSNMAEKVNTIKERLWNETNLQGALTQTIVVKTFLEALQNDTDLWGEDGYECTTYPETKVAFRNWSEYGKNAGFSYFPGMCNAARDFAYNTAKNQMCVENHCVIGEVIDVDSIEAESGELIGVDGLTNQIAAWEQSLNNIEVSCPECPTTPEQVVAAGATVLNPWKEYEIPIPEIENLDEAQQAAEQLYTAALAIGVNDPNVTYGWKNESFCEDLEVPCPDFSRYEDLTTLVQDYRLAKFERYKELAAEIEPPVFEADQLPESYFDILNRLLLQMDIASYIYVGYTCLSMFFPCPQIVFKVNFRNGIKQALFGVGKNLFLISAVALWWGIEYFQTFTISLQKFQLYMKLALEDPCIAKKAYTDQIGGNYSTVCNTLLQTQSKWTNAKNTIGSVLEATDLMEMEECCNTTCPTEYLRNFTAINENLGYRSIGDSIGESTFLGNLTSCDNYEFVIDEILELNEALEVSWWKVWIESGVLSAVLLPAVVANYGVALAKLADPLMVCDGKYEGPPAGFNFQDFEVEALMKEISFSLKRAAFGRAAFWGVFMNLLVFNIVFGKLENDGGDKRDAILASIILLISAVSVLVAAKASRLTNKRTELIQEIPL